MRDAHTMKILQAKQNLAKVPSAYIFSKFSAVTYGIKKVSTFDVLHNKKEIFRWLDNFVGLHEERMPNSLHNLDLSAYSLDICFLFYPLFVKNFDRHLLTCQLVHS